METKYVVGTVRHLLLCAWWLRSREVEPIRYADGTVGAAHELYVPWWAWPLELTHRAIFGSVKLELE